jgi:hypothetical protein
MASLVVSGDTSGAITVSAPAIAGTNTLTLPASTGTIVVGSSAVSAAGQIPFSTDGSTYTPTAKIVTGTAKPTTSGTSVDFTSIPSWAKRITIMFQGVSTSGTGLLTLQIGTGGSAEITGYTGVGLYMQNNNAYAAFAYTTSSFNLESGTGNSAYARHGKIVLDLYGSNTWYESHNVGTWTTTAMTTQTAGTSGSGFKALAGALDMIRLTTSNGTDTFDNGSININYE